MIHKIDEKVKHISQLTMTVAMVCSLIFFSIVSLFIRLFVHQRNPLYKRNFAAIFVSKQRHNCVAA